MKSTIFQMILATAAAIFAAYAVCIVFTSSFGMHEETNVITDFEGLLSGSKESFIEHADDIQVATAALMSMEGVQILRTASGGAVVSDRGGRISSLDDFFDEGGTEDAREAIRALLSGTETGITVYNIAVTPLAVQFYMSYHYAGYTGVLYEFELDSIKGIDTIELVENWKIFYNMDG